MVVSLWNHPAYGEGTFLPCFPSVIHLVGIVAIEIKVNIHEVVCEQIIIHLLCEMELALQYPQEVNFKPTLYPLFADPAVHQFRIKLDVGLILS